MTTLFGLQQYSPSISAYGELRRLQDKPSHTTILPPAYYTYLRVRWLDRPWGIGRDPGYRPRVTVVVPTYNELVELWFLPKSTEARGISTKTVKNISEFTHDTRRY